MAVTVPVRGGRIRVIASEKGAAGRGGDDRGRQPRPLLETLHFIDRPDQLFDKGLVTGAAGLFPAKVDVCSPGRGAPGRQYSTGEMGQGPGMLV